MASKAAIYMRISTHDQSVESQRHELRKFIEARDDLELAAEYADVISGCQSTTFTPRLPYLGSIASSR